MSYILNALKQSESQRNRGEIPHIDSQPEFVKAAPSKWSEPFWKWLALLAVAALLLALVWLKFGEQAGVGAVAPRPVPAKPATASLAPASSAPVREEGQASGLPALTGMAGVRISLGEDEVADTAAAAPVTPTLSESPRVVLDMPVARGVAPPPAAASVAASAPPAAPAPIPERSEPAASAADDPKLAGVSHWKGLPSGVQRELRELGVNALIYSSDPGVRFIRAAGRSLHEGDSLAPGLKLEQITRDGIVFSYQDGKYWMRLN